MRKRIQNKIAESRYTLTFVALYALAVWYLAGIVEHQYYVQLACFTIGSYLMVELNNANALILKKIASIATLLAGGKEQEGRGKK